ncbi:glycine/betaine ABC transporter ATP-binding protein [Burkholderia multivorans]|nr:glycine/betaine ABC transporter ATP-binding protein [Burkholderia multivorans]PRH23704.1 glycine/betaine ABC transporter ATP-binding protein [Burkholderia multivorans]
MRCRVCAIVVSRRSRRHGGLRVCPECITAAARDCRVGRDARAAFLHGHAFIRGCGRSDVKLSQSDAQANALVAKRRQTNRALLRTSAYAIARRCWRSGFCIAAIGCRAVWREARRGRGPCRICASVCRNSSAGPGFFWQLCRHAVTRVSPRYTRRRFRWMPPRS